MLLSLLLTAEFIHCYRMHFQKSLEKIRENVYIESESGQVLCRCPLSHWMITDFCFRSSGLLPNRFRWCDRLERGDMAKCGWANGGVRKWPWKYFSPLKKPAGFAKLRFTRPFSCAMKTSWVSKQCFVRMRLSYSVDAENQGLLIRICNDISCIVGK